VLQEVSLHQFAN